MGRSSFPNGSHRWLCAFFSLVAAGFLLQFLTHAFDFLGPELASGLLVFDSLLGVVDPPVLLAFSLAVLGSQRLRWPWLWIGYLVAGPVVFYFSVTRPAGAVYPSTTDWAPILYVNGTYLACFGLLLRAYLLEPYKFRERQVYFVLLAVGFAAFSRSGAIFFAGLRSSDPGLEFVLPSFVLGILLLVAFYAFGRLHVRAAVRGSTAVFASLFALLAGFAVAYYLIVLWDDLLGFNASLRTQYFGLRWLVVGGILGYGIVRHQLFDFGLRTRQAAAFLSALLVGLVASFTIAVQVQASGASINSARFVGLAGGIAGSLLAYHGVAWLWKRHGRGADLPPSFRRRRLELYEAALEFSLQNREWTLAERLFADTLRDVFQITAEEHERVLELLRSVPSKAR